VTSGVLAVGAAKAVNDPASPTETQKIDIAQKHFMMARA
jgi:hypothetical protein